MVWAGRAAACGGDSGGDGGAGEGGGGDGEGVDGVDKGGAWGVMGGGERRWVVEGVDRRVVVRAACRRVYGWLFFSDYDINSDRFVSRFGRLACE